MKHHIMTREALASVADWHAAKAIAAYRRRNYAVYARHIAIADAIRSAG